MMCIQFTDDADGDTCGIFEWHIGDKVSEEMLTKLSWGKRFVPDLVQADGHELEWIIGNFPGLIIPRGRVVRFFGDTARLIAGNISSRT